MPDALRRPHAEIPARSDLRGKDLVLYDGECGLCDRSVRFLLARDHRDRLRFAPLQSAWARWALAPHTLPASRDDSIHVVAEIGTERERVLIRSAGALRLARAIGLPWSLALVFWIVPRPLRDLAYRFIAWRRRKWFAAPTCPIGSTRSAGSERKLLDDAELPDER